MFVNVLNSNVEVDIGCVTPCTIANREVPSFGTAFLYVQRLQYRHVMVRWRRNGLFDNEIVRGMNSACKSLAVPKEAAWACLQHGLFRDMIDFHTASCHQSGSHYVEDNVFFGVVFFRTEVTISGFCEAPKVVPFSGHTWRCQHHVFVLRWDR